MHIVNRCLKNMLLIPGYSPQGACPVCSGAHWTGSSAAPGASFPPHICAEGTAALSMGKVRLVVSKCCKTSSEPTVLL